MSDLSDLTHLIEKLDRNVKRMLIYPEVPIKVRTTVRARKKFRIMFDFFSIECVLDSALCDKVVDGLISMLKFNIVRYGPRPLFLEFFLAFGAAADA